MVPGGRVILLVGGFVLFVNNYQAQIIKKEEKQQTEPL